MIRILVAPETSLRRTIASPDHRSAAPLFYTTTVGRTPLIRLPTSPFDITRSRARSRLI